MRATRSPSGARELLHLLSIVPVQAAFRSDPDVSLGILEYARYTVIGKTISSSNVLELEMVVISGNQRLCQAP